MSNALYTNIPNNEAIHAVEEALSTTWPTHGKLSVKSITELLHLILNCNNFQFNGDNYLQIGGTAMGTRVAPSLANIIMQKIENLII